MKTDSDREKNVNSVKDLGVLIRKARKNLGLSQKEAAGLCGVGTRFLSELENGKESIEAGKSILVLKALGLRLTLSFHSRHSQKWKVSSEESGLVSKLDRGRNQPGGRPTDILHLRPRLDPALERKEKCRSDLVDGQLLFKIGGDCAGALSIGPFAEDPDLASYAELSSQDFFELLQNGNWLLNDRNDNRLSLAGAQGKLPLCFKNKRLLLPKNGAASNVIVKVNTQADRYPHLVENEYLCISLAQAVGIRTPKTTAKEMRGRPYLVSHRYDREVTASGSISRLHQEDFCQVLGLPPYSKYENEGGPSFQTLFATARSFLSPPEINEILRWSLFNLCIRNCDAHAKNISILYDESGAEHLAPFYDLVSTLFYPVSNSFAMRFGGAECNRELNNETLVGFAKSSGLGPPFVKQSLISLLRDLRTQLNTVALKMKSEGWDAPELMDLKHGIEMNIDEVEKRLLW